MCKAMYRTNNRTSAQVHAGVRNASEQIIQWTICSLILKQKLWPVPWSCVCLYVLSSLPEHDLMTLIRNSRETLHLAAHCVVCTQLPRQHVKNLHSMCTAMYKFSNNPATRACQTPIKSHVQNAGECTAHDNKQDSGHAAHANGTCVHDQYQMGI